MKILNLDNVVAGSSATQLAMHFGKAMKLSAVQHDQASTVQALANMVVARNSGYPNNDANSCRHRGLEPYASGATETTATA